MKKERPETYPMWNLMNFADPEVAQRWRQEDVSLCEVARNRGTKLSKLHRERLGPSYLTYGNRRYYTWDGPGWRAFVADGYGMKFDIEIPDPTSIPKTEKARKRVEEDVRRALRLWDSYLEAIGVPRSELDPIADKWLWAINKGRENAEKGTGK